MHNNLCIKYLHVVVAWFHVFASMFACRESKGLGRDCSITYIYIYIYICMSVLAGSAGIVIQKSPMGDWSGNTVFKRMYAYY